MEKKRENEMESGCVGVYKVSTMVTYWVAVMGFELDYHDGLHGYIGVFRV